MMENLIIDYRTGITNKLEGVTLDEAKAIAVDGMSYTQASMDIKNEAGETITTATWYGVAPDEDDDVLLEIGSGFYTIWSDEL